MRYLLPPLMWAAVPALAVAVMAPAASRAAIDYTATVLYPMAPPSDDYDANTVGQYGVTVAADGSAATGVRTADGSSRHALAWSGPASSAVDLHPTGLPQVAAEFPSGTDGAQQVGTGHGPTLAIGGHALLWSGTAASAVDLNPAGFASSSAAGVAHGQQVGSAATSDGPSHAILWTGTAASAVDLTPTAATLPGGPTQAAEAFATDGTQQVGDRLTATGSRAVVWSGSAGSAVDLHPIGMAGVTDSTAAGVGGGRQVGFGYNPLGRNYNYHALMWSGSAASVVDLTPADLPATADTLALATDGPVQAGYYNLSPGNSSEDHAIAWAGTAASAIDLHGLLPADGYWGESCATAVAADGDVYGYALGTYDGYAGPFAVRWSPAAGVPEPGVAATLLAAAGVLSTRRRRRHP